MCSRCLRQYTKTEIGQSEVDELWAILYAAYKQYQLEIVNGNKLYQRFVNDFISYQLPYFSRDEHLIRMHIKNVSTAYELLTERLDLIEKYFNKESFIFENFAIMLKEFNSVEHVHDYGKKMGLFNDAQIRILIDYINQEELFDDDIDESELKGFFSCTLQQPLIVRKMTWLLLMLNALAHYKFLVRGWQVLIVENQLLKSTKARKSITKSSITSNISRKRRALFNSIGELEPFKELINKLKEHVE